MDSNMICDYEFLPDQSNSIYWKSRHGEGSVWISQNELDLGLGFRHVIYINAGAFNSCFTGTTIEKVQGKINKDVRS
jgi:hypothetical protein